MRDCGSAVAWGLEILCESTGACEATGVSCILNVTGALVAGGASAVLRFGKNGAGDGWPAVWFATNWPGDDGFEDASESELLIVEAAGTDRFRTGRFGNAGVAADSLEIEAVPCANCGSTDTTRETTAG
jgi:hypothetical protein